MVQNRNDMLTGVGDLYTDNVNRLGANPASVGWRDIETQALRFEKLCTVIDRDSRERGFTANDLGSGYGAMFGYLDALCGGRLKRYYGYDISPEMLAAAEAAVADSRARWVEGARLTAFADYTFVSGTFNVKLDASDGEWSDYVRATLLEMAEKSTKGLAFNLLSSYVDWTEDHLFYGDPREFFDFCKTRISPRVSLLHDYPLYEWTITIRLES